MKRFLWGLIGGGKGSQIGPAHRLGATIDGKFDFVAGALDIDRDAARKFSIELKKLSLIFEVSAFDVVNTNTEKKIIINFFIRLVYFKINVETILLKLTI